MKKLTEQKYWESKYRVNNPDLTFSAYKSRLPSFIEKLLVPYMHDCQIKFIKDNIILPKNSRGVEVGSAPGYFITELAEKMNFEPYGIEYSQSGADSNKEIFKMHGYEDKNVIMSDFFSEDFLKNHEDFFDMVISRGFIEHFDSPEHVIKNHLKILKKGGYLVLIVPNKTGINRRLSLFFNRDSLDMHNLRIMRLKNFENAVPADSVEKILSRYFGIFDLYQFNPSKSKKRIHLAAMKLQKLLYLLYRIKPESINLDSRMFSPMLIFIGRRIK
ncbi:MAG: class I SAM-dependent methyltransferase [bacterium]